MDPAREPCVVAVGGGCGIFVMGCRAGVGVDAVPVGKGVHGAPGGAEERDAEDDAADEQQNSAEDVQGGVKPKGERAVFAVIAPVAIGDLLPSPCAPGDEGEDEAEDEAHEYACEFVGHHKVGVVVYSRLRGRHTFLDGLRMPQTRKVGRAQRVPTGAGDRYWRLPLSGILWHDGASEDGEENRGRGRFVGATGARGWLWGCSRPRGRGWRRGRRRGRWCFGRGLCRGRRWRLE